MNIQEIMSLPEQSVLEQLHSSAQGLSQSQADERRVTYGLNVLKKGKNTALRILGRQLKSSLIYLLVFACVFSFIRHNLYRQACFSF